MREYSLSLSCPVAARMMLTRKMPVSFLVTEDEKADELEEEFEDFDLLSLYRSGGCKGSYSCCPAEQAAFL